MRNPLRFTYLSKGRYWRFRHKLVGDVKLPYEKGLHWSKQPERSAFMEKYAELLAKVEGGAPKPVSRRSFPWLIDQYAKSAEFKSLADSTQLDYARTLNLLKVDLAAVHFETATRAILKVERDRYADQPRKAHKIKQMLSRLYTWADENGHVEAGVNPAGGIKRIKRKGGEREIVVWSDPEIASFLDDAPEHLVTPVMIALYTGQRREDVVSMTWQQYQGDTIRVRQSKTTAMLDITCHSKLRAHLDSIKKRGVVICTTEAGKAYTANALSQAVRRRVTSLPDLPPNRSMHGLRYAAGSKMEEAGCTIAEVSAVLGHRTHQMAMKYATQRQRSKAATAKLEASA